jgi:hypothetical protein
MNDDRLNTVLSAYETAQPGAELRARIIAAAPRQRTIGRVWRWAAGAALGFGMAGSCAAGVAAGFTLAPASVARLISGPTNAVSDSLADPAGDAASG